MNWKEMVTVCTGVFGFVVLIYLMGSCSKEMGILTSANTEIRAKKDVCLEAVRHRVEIPYCKEWLAGEGRI